MNKQNKHPNANIRNRLTTGLVIATAALSATAQSASAQPNSARSNSSPTTETAPAMTAADHELNEQAQQRVSTLAGRIEQIAASQPNNKPTLERGVAGEVAVVTATVQAGTEYGSDNAAYTLSFTSPATHEGKPQPTKAELVTISAGATGDTNDAPAPNVQLGFQMNPATGAWGASANYNNTLMNSTQSAVVGIDPVSSTVPRMNSYQLDALFDQGIRIIGNAQHKANIGNNFSLPEAFNQTTTPVSPAPGNSNGGTEVPPAPISPSGGTPAS